MIFGPETSGLRRTPSLKLRLIGLFCLVAGVLSIVGATTGWDSNGTPRAALWFFGVLLPLISLPLLISREPKVVGAVADTAGIVVELRDGRREQIAWNLIAAARLNGLGPPPHTTGWVLDLRAAVPSLAEHRQIGRWAQPRDGAAGHLVLPLPSHVGHALDGQLRQYAGTRYSVGT